MSLNKTEIEIEAGQTFQLVATVLPAEANQTITWSQSKASVAKVDKNGLVTAVKAGVCIVTASSPELKEASCTVTVTAAPVTLTGISVSGAKN